MFLALIIPAFLSPCFLPTVHCELSKKGSLPVFSNNGSINFSSLFLTPFEAVNPTPKLRLLQIELPHLEKPRNKTRNISKSRKYKKLLKDLVKREDLSSSLSRRKGPARMPNVRSNSKDYGESSHYRMKGARQSSKRGYYMSLLQKLLHKPRKKEHSSGSTSANGGQFDSGYALQKMSAMSAPGWGWGWGHGWEGKGWGKGGGGHGHGYSLLDVLLCGLSLLSLGGFLLNLLLNLMNLFGFGMMTSTATYPVTITGTQTVPGGTVITGTQTATASGLSGGGGGLGFTGRTIDSMAGNGWGWNNGNQAHLGIHIKLPHKGWGWGTTTTTTTTAPTGTYTGTLPTTPGTAPGGAPGGATGLAGGVIGRAVKRGFTVGGRKRPKRETFKPYVDPATALEVLAKAVLNSINSAMNKYECMQIVACENNKRARVIGQWLEYFMPVYSFSVSYIGHKIGAHDSLLDHIRAIVLGASETNCQAHFPHCDDEAMMD